MVFGGRRQNRVIVQEDDATRRARLIADAMTNIDLLEKYAQAYISINLFMWRQIKDDANIPKEIKYSIWEKSVKEFWETVRSGSLLTMQEMIKHAGKMILQQIQRLLEEED